MSIVSDDSAYKFLFLRLMGRLNGLHFGNGGLPLVVGVFFFGALILRMGRVMLEIALMADESV